MNFEFLSRVTPAFALMVEMFGPEHYDPQSSNYFDGKEVYDWCYLHVRGSRFSVFPTINDFSDLLDSSEVRKVINLYFKGKMELKREQIKVNGKKVSVFKCTFLANIVETYGSLDAAANCFTDRMIQAYGSPTPPSVPKTIISNKDHTIAPGPVTYTVKSIYELIKGNLSLEETLDLVDMLAPGPKSIEPAPMDLVTPVDTSKLEKRLAKRDNEKRCLKRKLNTTVEQLRTVSQANDCFEDILDAIDPTSGPENATGSQENIFLGKLICDIVDKVGIFSDKKGITLAAGEKHYIVFVCSQLF
jgi:hypothetical protein